MSLDAVASTDFATSSQHEDLLKRVSRTFALTIPQLPSRLREVVTNAYLLCRIADTIEDESGLSPAEKHALHSRFMDVVATGTERDAHAFAAATQGRFTVDASAAEVELLARTPEVVQALHGFGEVPRRALLRCVGVMCRGMPHYARHANLDGLPNQRALDRYCYHVAGVVGETLTALFCDHSRAVAATRGTLRRLGVSFGLGLQMVNILKDFWEDRARGVCWLPQDVFSAHGLVLNRVDASRYDPAFGAAYGHLASVAHAHLRNGLDYALTIPAEEPGIRRFCLLALALAVQTLQKIRSRPDFTHGKDVKISRQAVMGTLVKVRLLAARDGALRGWFDRLGHGLPVASRVLAWGHGGPRGEAAADPVK